MALHQLGFQALASTSAGFAFSLGLPDGAAAVPLERLLTHLEELVQATPLPVNADFRTAMPTSRRMSPPTLPLRRHRRRWSVH
jgi:2-methylisocitrate lyase-like PEP mutase family enzyme